MGTANAGPERSEGLGGLGPPAPGVWGLGSGV